MIPDSPPIHVLVVDDHKVVRVGLKTILHDSPDIRVIGEAGSVRAAIQECRRLQPHVVLLDIRLPDGNGHAACREIKAAQPGVRILVLTSVLDDQSIVEAIASGADGYLLKEIDDGQLVEAIRHVSAGGAMLDSTVTRRVLETVRSQTPHSKFGLGELSAQERRILSLLADGKTNKEIGNVLRLSEKTVRNYLTVVFEKLQVSNRAQAVALFVRSQGEAG